MSTLAYLKNQYSLDYSNKSPIEIPDVTRLDLAKWLRHLNFKKGVEVGVDHGDYSKIICDINTQMKLYGVDPYTMYDEYREYESQEQMDAIYRFASTRMEGYVKDGNYELVRKFSMDAVTDFEDESLDFVYIDANHEGDFPYQDLVEWYRKVKKNGIIAGHDYVRINILDFTIKDALAKFTEESNVHPWFIIGAYQVKPRLVRDRSRSWMIVK